MIRRDVLCGGGRDGWNVWRGMDRLYSRRGSEALIEQEQGIDRSYEFVN